MNSLVDQQRIVYCDGWQKFAGAITKGTISVKVVWHVQGEEIAEPSVGEGCKLFWRYTFINLERERVFF